ncbi:MAG: class I SAM-dependent methyltransferase [Deltaproteobacteria bacterium]|nr:class I SAM-dependent methyltransferase [Deltaproteobacteria bacterium]
MKRSDYGIDAPGLVRKMFLKGAGALLLILPAAFGFWPSRPWGVILTILLLLCAAYFLGQGGLMLYSSLIGKLKERERLLDLISWQGTERVLDVGCGRGLMLVGAARRLTAGRAVGIDLWQGADQADNRPEAALNNARIEGVAKRIAVSTADMRQLPFSNESFDVVISHWAVHNLHEADDRTRALSEMVRVLKPAGYVVLADIEHHAEYAATFKQLGLIDIRHVGDSPMTAIMAAASFGNFRPTAVAARKMPA